MPLDPSLAEELQKRGLSVPGAQKPDTAGLWAEIEKRGLKVDKPAEAEKPGLGAAIWEGIKRAGSDVVEQGKRIGATQLGGPEMMMQFSPADEKAVADRLTQQEKQSAKSYEDSPARMAHPLAAGAGRVGGNVAAAAPFAAVPAGGPGMALGGRVALGGAMGGATGGPMGAAAGAGMSGLGGMIGPALSPAFQAIAQKFPNLARMAIGAEGRTPEAFRRSTANEVLQPLNQSLPRSVKDGHDLVNAVEDKIDNAYNAVLPKVTFRATEPNPETGESFVTGLQSLAQDVPEAHGKDFERLITRQFTNRLDEGGNMSGRAFKDADSAIAQKSTHYLGPGANATERDYGKVLLDLRANMRDTLAEHNPMEAQALKQADQAWVRFVRMQEAAGRRADASGEFMPNDLLIAARKKQGNRAFSSGDLPMQAFGRAGNDLIAGKQPNLQRILTDLAGAAAGAGAAHAVGAGPWGAAAGAAVGGAGADIVRGATSRLRAFPQARTAGEVLGRAAPVAGGVTDETHISPVGP